MMHLVTFFISVPRWRLTVRFETTTLELGAAVAARWDGIIGGPFPAEGVEKCPTIRFVEESEIAEQCSWQIKSFFDDGLARRQEEGSERIETPSWAIRFEPGKGSEITTISKKRPLAFGEVAGAVELALIHALALRGSWVVHGCCFEFGGRSVLALGPSYAGKSTLAAAVLAAGGAIVSDDSVVVKLGDDNRLHASFFRDALIFRNHMGNGLLRRFAGSVQILFRSKGVRWAIRRQSLGASARSVTGVDEVWVLEKRQGLPSVVTGKASSAEVFASVVEGSAPLFLSGQFPRERELLLPVVRLLSEGVPRFSVALGPDLLAEPLEVIRRLLERTASNTTGD